jgi:lipocalin
MSSKDNVCIDIGKVTATSILNYEKTKEIISLMNQDRYSGKWKYYEIDPIPIFYRNKTINTCLDAPPLIFNK